MRVWHAGRRAKIGCDALQLSITREDEEQIPAQFQKSAARLIVRFLISGEFEVKRKYPLISDILARLAEAASEADYLIYTNVDASCSCHFYTSLADSARGRL